MFTAVQELLFAFWIEYPRESDLAHKRKVQTNPCKGVRRSKSAASFEPQNVSLSSRIKKFPDQHLSINKGKLLRCMQKIPVPKTILSNNFIDNKHPHCTTIAIETY